MLENPHLLTHSYPHLLQVYNISLYNCVLYFHILCKTVCPAESDAIGMKFLRAGQSANFPKVGNKNTI